MVFLGTITPAIPDAVSILHFQALLFAPDSVRAFLHEKGKTSEDGFSVADVKAKPAYRKRHSGPVSNSKHCGGP